MQKGYTIVPLDVHLSKGRVKITIALAKGKKIMTRVKTSKKRTGKKYTKTNEVLLKIERGKKNCTNLKNQDNFSKHLGLEFLEINHEGIIEARI